MGVKVEMNIEQRLEQALSVLDEQKEINHQMVKTDLELKIIIEHLLTMMDLESPFVRDDIDVVRKTILDSVSEHHSILSNSAAIILKNYIDRYSEIVLHQLAISNMESGDGDA